MSRRLSLLFFVSLFLVAFFACLASFLMRRLPAFPAFLTSFFVTCATLRGLASEDLGASYPRKLVEATPDSGSVSKVQAGGSAHASPRASDSSSAAEAKRCAALLARAFSR